MLVDSGWKIIIRLIKNLTFPRDLSRNLFEKQPETYVLSVYVDNRESLIAINVSTGKQKCE